MNLSFNWITYQANEFIYWNLFWYVFSFIIIHHFSFTGEVYMLLKMAGLDWSVMSNMNVQDNVVQCDAPSSCKRLDINWSRYFNHYSNYGIVCDICHTNSVNISGLSKNFPRIDCIHYGWQLTMYSRKRSNLRRIRASQLRSKQPLIFQWGDVNASG